jgi:hypothetical protein
MLTLDLYFERELKKLIFIQIEEFKEHLASGNAENYQRTVGIIAGLRNCLELCDEANRLAAKSYS